MNLHGKEMKKNREERETIEIETFLSSDSLAGTVRSFFLPIMDTTFESYSPQLVGILYDNVHTKSVSFIYIERFGVAIRAKEKKKNIDSSCHHHGQNISCTSTEMTIHLKPMLYLKQ